MKNARDMRKIAEEFDLKETLACLKDIEEAMDHRSSRGITNFSYEINADENPTVKLEHIKHILLEYGYKVFDWKQDTFALTAADVNIFKIDISW